MKRKTSVSQFAEDDGRVIAPMDLEGMPWEGKRPFRGAGTGKKFPPLGRDSLRMALGALLAALSVGLIFLGGGFLFILFCVKIWL